MRCNGLEPSPVSYNTLIGALYRAGKVTTAHKPFEEMQTCGQTLVLSTYTVMLDGLCKNGNIDEATELFESVKDPKLEPGIQFWSISKTEA
ncbi:hypothetical protein ACFX19_012823 [Malus domestica]